jgi:hypothetical protein
MLAVAAVVCLSFYYRRGSRPAVPAAGAIVGLVFLTKPEAFAAAAAATLLTLLAALWVRRAGLRASAALAGAFVAAAAVPPAVAFALLATAMPAADALSGVAGAWPAIAATSAASLGFYRYQMGVDDVAATAGWIGRYLLVLAAVFAPAACLDFWAGRKRPATRARAARWAFDIYLALLIGLTIVSVERPAWVGGMDWLGVFWPMQVLLAAMAVFAAVRVVRGRRGAGAATDLYRLSIILLALGLLGKILLRAKIHHYGFSLGMPGAVLLVAAAIDWLPAAARRIGGAGKVLRAAGAAVVIVGSVAIFRESRLETEQLTYSVGSGADRMLTNEQARLFNAAAEAIDETLGPEDTLAVLPEGVMLNYMTRRTNPTGYLNFTPLELCAFGEGRIVAAFESRPPDYIFWVFRPVSAFGGGHLGVDFGHRLGDWIRRNYVEVWRISDPKRRGWKFDRGRLFRRKDLPPRPGQPPTATRPCELRFDP